MKKNHIAPINLTPSESEAAESVVRIAAELNRRVDYPIQGRMYTDGGLLNPLPLWAARDMGATQILAIDVLPRWPVFRYPAPPPDLEAAVLEPKARLGGLLASVRWTEANAKKWIDAGRADARNFLLK